MKPQKLQRSATWWQIVRKGELLGGTDRPTKRTCIEDYCDAMNPGSSKDHNFLWAELKKEGRECVKIAAFWEVSK